MRFPTRGLTLVVLVAGCPYDPAELEFEVITDTDANTSSGGSNTLGTSVTDPDTTEGPTSPSTTSVDTDEPTDTDSPAECGDGEINGDEVCDDGTNDGSYDGCMPGCAAAGPSCGDGELNGDEVCDDSTNDGSYGGCAAGCAALGPYCGDADVHATEMCDNGAANANGSGCNIDCVVSGTVVGTWTLGDLSFCDGSFTTRPVFRDDGNALISASGYCNDDSVVLAELSPQVELVQEFDDLLLPQTPLRTAAMAADAWLLASYGCSYAISIGGELTEACAERIAGSAALSARDDGSYIALDYGVVGSYAAGSPMDGDSPDWQVNEPDDGFYDYGFYDAVIGASDATIIVGTRRQISNNDYVGYLARYTAAGNSAGSNSYASIENLGVVTAGSDGTIAVASGYPNYRVMRLAPDFGEAWGLDVPSSSDVLIGVDSTGAVVMAYVDSVTNNSVMRKWTTDGTSELWSIEIGAATYGAHMAIAPDDSIWVATATFNSVGVAKVAP